MSGNEHTRLLEVIEKHLTSDIPLTIASLGGITVLMAQAKSLAASPFLDVLAELAGCALSDETMEMDSLLLEGFANCQDPCAIRAAADIVICDLPLRQRVSARLATILEKRIETQNNDKQALIAAYALEALFRLALVSCITKFIPLKILACIKPEINSLYALHAAKLAGVAFSTWQEPDLINALNELRKIDGAEGEAAFELALANLSKALDAGSIEEINQYLEVARVHLRDAQAADEDRADAAAYTAAIDIIRGFHTSAEPAFMNERMEALARAVQDRALLLDKQYFPDWLLPRADREIQWVRLIRSVQQACKDLTRPSWLKAGAVIENLLEVFDADRTFGTRGGLGQLLRPKIEASFVRERGQLAHLDELLDEPDWEPKHKNTARALRARITQMEDKGITLGKYSPNASYPILQQLLGSPEVPSDWSLDVLHLLETALQDRYDPSHDFSNPVVQRLLQDATSNLASCWDYSGEIRLHFNELLAQIILFCKTRQDGGTKELRDRGNYLRDRDATEFDLQQDLWQWLSGNFRHGEILDEVEGIATGRADLYAGFGGHRFVIELKRHHGYFDRTTAKGYCNQAASYQNTNVKLGFLGVLEIADRIGPPPSLEECIWYDAVVPINSSVARHLIIFKVPGNLISPSSMSSKTPKPRKKKVD
ncbi:hypothetical protein DZA28_13765 [Pseudomonas alloputida]|uniref:DUF3883 domain-containing protein n=1 Tax=Pseudomonas alloputida TaxID=1940621 RepID=A0ABY3D5N5_9PSED|nr:hypothetical protein [Pseudomonas alloputida]TRZ60944.1 hypothetical protein DZA28_13765 [Pseudomonas alloputida]